MSPSLRASSRHRRPRQVLFPLASLGALVLSQLLASGCGGEGAELGAANSDSLSGQASSSFSRLLSSPLDGAEVLELMTGRSLQGDDLATIDGGFHAAGGVLYFAGGSSEDPGNLELWRTHGATGTAIQIFEINTHGPSTPRHFVSAGPSVFFTADTAVSAEPPVVEAQLWVSAGGVGNTLSLTADTEAKNPRALGPIANGGVLFMAEDADGNRWPWVSDGTVEGTRALGMQENPSPGASGGMVEEPAVLANGLTYFIFDSLEHGTELWVTDGSDDAWLVSDLNPGSADSSPSELLALPSGELAFIDQARGGVCIVDDSSTPRCDISLNSPTQLSFHQGRFYMIEQNAGGSVLLNSRSEIEEEEELIDLKHVHDDELAQVLGYVLTPSRLFVLNDKNSSNKYPLYAIPFSEPDNLTFIENFVSIDPQSLTAVGDALLFFGDRDGDGDALWASAGEGFNTRPLDLGSWETPFADSRRFTVHQKLVHFVADSEGVALPLFLDGDSVDTPPSITCPPQLELVGDVPGGADLLAFFAENDQQDLGIQITDEESELDFSLSTEVAQWGEKSLLLSVQDHLGSSASCEITTSVTHPDDPILECPEDFKVESPWPNTQEVSFEYQASHPLAPVDINVTPPSGSEFVWGVNPVNITATAAGNSVWCSFTITLEDTTPPELICPEPIMEEATGHAGAEVSWDDPEVIGESVEPTITSDLQKGDTYPLGESEVHISVKDEVGNESQCLLKITVQDTTPPQIECPENISVQAPDKDGAFIEARIDTEDLVSIPTLEVDPPLDERFPVGQTTVHATSTDTAGNESECSFVVTVQEPPKNQEGDSEGPDDEQNPDEGKDDKDSDGKDSDDKDKDKDDGDDSESEGCGGCSASGAAQWALLIPLFGFLSRNRRRLALSQAEGFLEE